MSREVESEVVRRFEESLSPGMKVRARWTARSAHNVRYFSAKAEVAEIERDFVYVRLLVPVGAYRIGERIGIPRSTSRLARFGNRVEPMEGYPVPQEAAS